MKRIVLLRHGESLWNKENRFTGWTDVDLSEKGVEEACKAGDALREAGFSFEAAYTSYLKRAVKTLNCVLDRLDEDWIPVEKTWRLNEKHYGMLHEITENSGPIEREFYEFYRTQRGEFTPEGATLTTTTHPTLSSNVKFMNFYPFEDIETISPRPMLFITGENAHSREFSEDAYRLAADPKELYIVPGAGHVDLYDRVGLIPFDKLESFFKEYLKK